jgi:DNA repair exonuclease SbcCD ATPase subunit
MTENGQLNDASVDGESGGAGIVFDSASGISQDEQREILAAINRVAEKNRQSLSAGAVPAGKGRLFTAKKKGGLFPVLVNAAAVLFLAGGFFLLSSLHGREDTGVREGNRVYNSAERALIEEIRRETSSKIEAKENEISQISSKLEDVDAELRELYSSNEELTAEQRAAEESLRGLQEEYRSSLATLRDERSQILEEARAREAVLRAQFEERTRELSAAADQSLAALSSARSELERLGGEREKAALVESQLGAYFAAVSDQIRGGGFAEALDTLAAMRVFLDTPAFSGLPSIQTRKDLYTRAINSIEEMTGEVLKREAGGSPEDAEESLAEALEKNAQLEETIAGLNRTVAAFNTQGSDLGRRLGELEESAAALRGLNAALEQSAAAKDDAISALEAQNAGLGQTVAAREAAIEELRSQNAAQEEENASLNTQLNSLRDAIRALSQ